MQKDTPEDRQLLKPDYGPKIGVIYQKKHLSHINFRLRARMKIHWTSRTNRLVLGIAGAVVYPLAASTVLDILTLPTYGSYTCSNRDAWLHPAYGGHFWSLSLLWLVPGIAAFVWMLRPLKWHWAKIGAMTSLYFIVLFWGILTFPELYGGWYIEPHIKAGCPQPLRSNLPWDYELKK